MTPAALRILKLIYGETVQDATSEERDFAWYYVQNLPSDRRLMQPTSLDQRKSVYRTRTSK